MSSTITLDRDSLNKALLSASLRRDSSDCNIAGLWPDLSTASSVLRIANSIPGILDANQCCVDDDGLRVCKDGPVFDKTTALKINEFGVYIHDSWGKKVKL